MAIITDAAERWAAQTVWNAAAGRERFGADAAREVVTQVRALPAKERPFAWHLIDGMTETSFARVETSRGVVAVQINPVSRPDPAAAAILAEASQFDIGATGQPFILGEKRSDGSPVGGTSALQTFWAVDFTDEPYLGRGGPGDFVQVRRGADGTARLADPPPVPTAAVVSLPAVPVASEPVASPAVSVRVATSVFSAPPAVGSDAARDAVLKAIGAGPVSTVDLINALPQIGRHVVIATVQSAATQGLIRFDGGWRAA